MAKPVKIARILRSDAVGDELAMVLLSQNTINRAAHPRTLSRYSKTNCCCCEAKESYFRVGGHYIFRKRCTFHRVRATPWTENNVRQFLFCCPLVKNTTGKEMFKKVDSLIEEHQLLRTYCVPVCADGASIMMRTKIAL